jgi:DNA-binding transcriptional LysR family regulator
VSSARFTLRQLEIFIAVARTGNINRAAEILHLSPSATSAAITELERSVAARLCIRRKGRGVQRTPEGRMFEELAARLLDDASEMANAIAEYNSATIHGTLRLGCHTPLSASFLPSLMQGFTSRHPSVEIELTEGPENELREMMLDGLVDVALSYERPAHPELECIHLVSRRPYVIVAPDHRFAGRDRIGLADLADDPLILITVGSGDKRIMSWFAAAGVTPRVRWNTHDIEMTRALVGRGLGYAVLMQRRRHDVSLDGFEICTLEIDPPVEPEPVYLIAAHAAAGTKRVQAFTEFARETHRELPAWSGAIPAPERLKTGAKTRRASGRRPMLKPAGPGRGGP